MMLISLTVQIGLALPMIFYFHRVAFTGISANIAVVPLLSAAVPIVFAALLTGWKWLAWIGKLLLDLSRAVVDLHVQWEPAWRTPDPPFWFALTFVAALIAAGLLQGRLRALASVAVIALFAVLCRAPFGPAVPVGRMELTAIDVGQGDSLLLTLPEGRTVLIDGGGFPTFGHSKPSSFDMGEEVVSPYLWSRQIRDVDVVVTTHAHEDHTGGMRALIENFHPKELWTGADSEESPVWRSVAEAAHGAGTKIVPMQTGRKFHFGGADFEVLWPAADYIPARSPKNNDSLVFRVSYGKRSFLLTGDMEKQAEARLLAENLVQGVDVLKVGHHGSRTSSIEPFLDAVHAPFALVSVGAGNSYRHPSPEVLERLEQRHSSILRTDEKGQVVISTDGRKIEVNTYHWLHPEQAGSLALGAPFGAGF
jgi:competence protein ComEC